MTHLSVDLDYNSQAVDAQTDKSNGQASWVGNGWDLNPGFIERHMISCAAVSRFGTADTCTPTIEDYTLSLPGQSGEIVLDTATGTMRLANDPGWSISKVTDSSVPATYSQHWVLVDPKGTQYYFGEATEPGTGAATNAQLNEPVFATSGQACYTATAATSFCQQQWRWMLDRVVDRNGNETALFWTKESNNYRSSAAGAIEPYSTNAVISRIDYGFQSGTEATTTPHSKVVFYSGYRCKQSSGTPDMNCAAPVAGTSTGAQFPDVPTDQLCSATSCGNYAPTFFTTRFLSQIITYYYNRVAAVQAYEPVTVIDLAYTFPATPGAGVVKMWLSNVTRTGDNGPGGTTGGPGNSIALPNVHFGGTELPNNVNTAVAGDTMHVYRVGWIDNEMGGELLAEVRPTGPLHQRVCGHGRRHPERQRRERS